MHLAIVADCIGGDRDPAAAGARHRRSGRADLATWRLNTPWTAEPVTVRFEGDSVVAEVADTSELRERGLGYRDELANGTGMLFVYN